MPVRRSARVTVFLGVCLSAAVAFAQGAPPPAVQASTFAKILAFDRAIDRGKLKVLLVYEASKDAAALQQAFAGAGVTAEPVAAAAAGGRFEVGGVAYLLPGTDTAALLDAAKAAHTLTIAGDAALAEQGKVSIGLGMRGDKPDIVVNLGRVADEGHDLSAQLLSFARVIRPTGTASGADTLQAPVLVNLTKPEYPPMARKLQVQGDVVMRLTVDAGGKVTNVELLKGLGRAGIDEVAVAAAKTAHFKAATRNGTPIVGTYVLTMPFRL